MPKYKPPPEKLVGISCHLDQWEVSQLMFLTLEMKILVSEGYETSFLSESVLYACFMPHLCTYKANILIDLNGRVHNEAGT